MSESQLKYPEIWEKYYSKSYFAKTSKTPNENRDIEIKESDTGKLFVSTNCLLNMSLQVASKIVVDLTKTKAKENHEKIFLAGIWRVIF